MQALAFSAEANLSEVVRLADGRLAERVYNARKGKWGWMVYSTSGARESFYTDKQWRARQ